MMSFTETLSAQGLRQGSEESLVTEAHTTHHVMIFQNETIRSGGHHQIMIVSVCCESASDYEEVGACEMKRRNLPRR